MTCVLFLLLLGLASDVRGQPADQAAIVTLTLEDAIERGVKTSARVREVSARADAATAVADSRPAHSESAALGAERRVTEGDLRLDIARAYWTLVAAIEQLRVVEQSIVRTE